MKTGMKVFWISSVVLVIIAAVLAITGVALGGTVQSPGRFSGITIGNTGVVFSPTWENVDINNLQLATSDADVNNHSHRTLYNDIRSLNIETGAINTVIRQWDGTGVNVDTSYLSRDVERRLTVNQSGDTLRISTGNRTGNVFGLNITNDVLIIQVPTGQEFASVIVDVGAGQLIADQLTANRIDITVGAGRMDVAYLEADILEVDIGAGQGIIEEFQADRIDMSVGAGQLDVTGSVEERASIDCGVGDITFNVRGSQDDFGHSISVGIGDATFGSLSVGGLGRNSTGNLHLDRVIDINVGIGSVTVNFLN
jgi:hypothetical protein